MQDFRVWADSLKNLIISYIYLQSRYNVACILYKLIQIGYLPPFLKLVHQIQLQMTKFIWYWHIYVSIKEITPLAYFERKD